MHLNEAEGTERQACKQKDVIHEVHVSRGMRSAQVKIHLRKQVTVHQ
jgi:hypothetical protein